MQAPAKQQPIGSTYPTAQEKQSHVFSPIGYAIRDVSALTAVDNGCRVFTHAVRIDVTSQEQ